MSKAVAIQNLNLLCDYWLVFEHLVRSENGHLI